MADCVMVVGFEKMSPGSMKSYYADRESPIGTFNGMVMETKGITTGPMAAQWFGNAGREYMEKSEASKSCPLDLKVRLLIYGDRYGAKAEDFAEIARVSHSHSQRNPYSQFNDVYTLDQVLASPTMHFPLTKLQCCPTSDGGAAAIIVSQAFLDARPHLKSQAVLIAGQCLATDAPSAFDRSAINLMGHEMTKVAAQTAFAEANVQAKDIKVCELHDCFSANEMIVIDALGLSEPGKGHEMVQKGDITYGGHCVINPSGGLISKGHPLGATGIAQCCELVWQLRGWANNRLVNGVSAALQHNLGLGGAVVVTVYKRADGSVNEAVGDEVVKEVTGLGYNPAVEARGFSQTQAESVRSRTRGSEWALGETGRRVLARF